MPDRGTQTRRDAVGLCEVCGRPWGLCKCRPRPSGKQEWIDKHMVRARALAHGAEGERPPENRKPDVETHTGSDTRDLIAGEVAKMPLTELRRSIHDYQRQRHMYDSERAVLEALIAERERRKASL